MMVAIPAPAHGTAITDDVALHAGTASSAQLDHALVQRVLRGDVHASRQLLDRCLPLIYSVMKRMGLSAQDADDASHDVVVKLLQSLHQFRGDAKLSTWVFTLARRMAVDFWRARHHREQVVDFNDPDNEYLQGEPSGQSQFEQQRDADKLTRLLDHLGEPVRTVMLRFYLADDSIADIAEEMNLAEGTVKTHLFRGRAQLREALEKTA